MQQFNNLNIGGELCEFNQPKVMAIINTTPDSFYATSRDIDIVNFEKRIEKAVEEGCDFVDVGGYSSRPGAENVSIAQERERIAPALSYLAKKHPAIPVSVDTFRSEVAAWAIENFNVKLINDISGGDLDAQMFNTILKYKVAYVIMHMRGNPKNMQNLTFYNNVSRDVLANLASKCKVLRQMGISNIMVDPGFGFSKTTLQNYELLSNLPYYEMLDAPILVGISRKSMIYKTLDCEPEDSLNGTTVLNTIALLNGASVLRVHDVKEAVEAIKIVKAAKFAS